MRIVIFTDLDGCLLNHDDYSYDAAGPSLERIRRLGIPLVLATSKTRRETEVFSGGMRLRAPFIVENGGGIFIPSDHQGWNLENAIPRPPYAMIALGKPYAEIRRFVEKIRPSFGIMGFGDLTVREIARLADLPLKTARLAKERDFTEPFLLEKEGLLEALEVEAAKEGIKVTKGGRFYHLIGVRQDKGEAVKIVRRLYDEEGGEPVTAVGIGDSPNDLPMLALVDIPVLIPHADGTYENIRLPRLIRAADPGSRGWNDVMERVLDDIERRHS